MEALASLAKYNITVFSGNESRPGIGAKPQLQVMELLESMDGDALIRLFRGVIKLLEGMLSSAMERAEWSSSAVTLYRGVTPPTSEIVAVRSRSIDLLRKLFALAPDLRSKLIVIRTLTAATRPERDAVIDPEYVDMIADNACSVLRFFTEIVPTADRKRLGMPS